MTKTKMSSQAFEKAQSQNTSIKAALEIIEDCVEEHKWSMECDRKNGIYTTVEYNKKIKEIDTSLQLLKEKVHVYSMQNAWAEVKLLLMEKRRKRRK